MQLPKSTEFNKRIPKQKFYENLSINPEMKRLFVEEVAVIYWKYKIAATTINVEEGKVVKEIEVFHIRLNQKGLNPKVMQLIDREIPYHILFLLEYEEQFQIWIGYKEKSLSNTSSNFKLNTYYHTEWQPLERIELKIDGLNMDAIYENFIRQIAGDALAVTSEEDIKVSIERDYKRRRIMKQIETLEKKIKKEKQFNIQVKLNTELKKLKKEMETF